MQTVGIIPSPGIAHQHAKKIIPNETVIVKAN